MQTWKPVCLPVMLPVCLPVMLPVRQTVMLPGRLPPSRSLPRFPAGKVLAVIHALLAPPASPSKMHSSTVRSDAASLFPEAQNTPRVPDATHRSPSRSPRPPAHGLSQSDTVPHGFLHILLLLSFPLLPHGRSLSPAPAASVSVLPGSELRAFAPAFSSCFETVQGLLHIPDSSG